MAGKPRVDRVHLRGSSGKVAYTRSVAKVLAEVGLITEQEADEMSRNKNVKSITAGGPRTRPRRTGPPGRPSRCLSSR